MFSTITVDCLFIWGFFTGASCNCNSYFQTEPQDVTITEGDDAFFLCKVSNVNRLTDSLVWVTNPNKYEIIISPSKTTEINEITSVLTVLNVGRTGQTQRCVLNYMDDNLMMRSCESRVSRIVVQYFPSEDEIECGPQDFQPVEEGEIYSVWCKVPRGNPLVSLTWNVDENSRDIHLVSIDENTARNEVFSVLVVNVTRLANSQMIACFVTSDSAREPVSCTIGPLSVLYKPSLSITPSNVSIRRSKADDIKINCSGDGNPSVREISWTCFPLVEYCSNVTGRTLTIIADKMTRHIDSQIRVTCFSSNALGESNATSLILLTNDSHRMDEPATETSNYRNISLILQQCDVGEEMIDPVNITLACMVHCIGCFGGEYVKVRWHSNGFFLLEDESALNNEGITKFHITFTTFFTAARRNIVTCYTVVYWNSSIVYKGQVFTEVSKPQRQVFISAARPTETSAVQRSYSLTTTSSMSVQDNITYMYMKNWGKNIFLFTALGIAGGVVSVISVFVVLLVVLCKILRGKAGLLSDAVRENSSNMFLSSETQHNEGPNHNIVNSDLDYEEPLQTCSRKCFLDLSKQDDGPSPYEMNMLEVRFSISSQGTSDTSSDSLQCCITSDEQSSESFSSS